MLWGGVTSCSNGSDDSDPIEKPETPKDPEEPAKPEKVAIGLTELNSWWGEGFEVSAKTDTSATIKVIANGGNYKQYEKMCGADISFGDKNKASLKVKNNGAEPAYVKIDIKNDKTGSAVTAAKVNDDDADVQWGGADTTIPAGGEVVFAFTFDASKKADKFIVGLNNNGEKAPTSGDITISEAYMWKVE